MQKIKLNQRVYPKDVVFSAAYALIEKAYFIFDEDPKKNIIVNIEPKKRNFKLMGEFKQELLNQSVYKKSLENTKEIRLNILKRALLTENERERKTI
jgi:His-Xaa-Ser system protein HxsD